MTKLTRIWAMAVVVLALVLLIVAATALPSLLRSAGQIAAAVTRVEHHEEIVLQVLRSEELMFLVTDRIVTRIDVEMTEHSLLAGGRQGVLLATARIYYGIDLKHLDLEHAIREEPGRVVVEFPRPTVLDVAIDPDWKLYDKRTGMWVIADWFTGRDVEKELRSRLKERAIDFAEKNDLLPAPAAVLARLNRYAAALSARAGKPVEFRYAGESETRPATQP
ncbi:MAG: DUF4230 domain-containing protein [Planctomycetes bacterium]|nr:DUF4230 domain-containing protein [Planctomycetota bacterium]